MKTISFNKIILIGQVTTSPEVNYYDSLTCRATFKLETYEETFQKSTPNKSSISAKDTHTIVAYGTIAKQIETEIKIDQTLYIEGTLKYRLIQYKDKRPFYTPEILALKIETIISNETQSSSKPNITTKEETPSVETWQEMMKDLENDPNDILF